ncbi:lipopolysaccharide biosynthesis protein [Rufibacter glacialis]|uniref:Lipopolysaccharide biosynthesis protein n=1 Tax=Rufibacter glacialis TaxID=1259555 RepID=A0A5M8QF05_9BACT|nr:lipopolysaccharide biosynthesis protein [Rufibacter glacialis]KAA6433336.1 lipopolysaccharide biosynthesis protein [Rufibacter glacialis]GGK75286.1 polysaccharide biosynthesis protein [Rufibacter glacialis]
MSLAKKLVGQTAAYGLSSIVGRALNYLLVPLYTTVFEREEYGVVTYLYAIVAFLNIVYTYGMETAFFRFANKPGVDRRELYHKVQTLILVSSLLLTVLILLNAASIAAALDYPGKEKYIIWLAITMAVDALSAIPFARLRLENQAIRFAVIRLVNIFLVIGGNLFFLVFCQQVYEGKYLAELRPLIEAIYDPTLGVGYIFLVNMVANLLFIPMLWREFSDFRFKLDLGQMKPMLGYAFPILVMGLAGATNEMLSRVMLEHWLPEGFYPGVTNKQAVGVFGATYKLAIMMSLMIQAFRYSAEPFFFAQAQDKNSPATFAVVMRWFVIVCALAYLGISANLDIFQYFLGQEEYRTGLEIVPVLLLAYLFNGVYYNLTVWFKLTDKTHYGTYITIFGAIVTVVANYLLIPVLGYMGSAIAAFLCYFSMAVVCYAIGQKYFPVPYPIKAIFGYLLLASGLIWLAYAWEMENFWLRQAYHLGLCAVFLAVVWVVEKPLQRQVNR